MNGNLHLVNYELWGITHSFTGKKTSFYGCYLFQLKTNCLFCNGLEDVEALA